MQKSYPKSRKIHTKSRSGCLECKRRHIRCDETRPICKKCTFSNRQCSFPSPSDHGPITSSRSDPIRESTRSGLRPASPVARTPPQATLAAISPTATSVAGSINLDHLELLHHFESETCKTIAISEEHVAVYHKAVISCGLHNQHLMCQILALSALHLSLVRPSRQEFYRSLASDLQSTALVGFHALLENVDKANCVDVLLFSHLIAMHVFCDTFNSLQDDFNVFLERLVGCIRLLNGVNVIIRSWWTELCQTEVGALMAEAERQDKKPKRSQGECLDLQRMIQQADLSSASIQTCQNAVERLQHYLDLENELDRPSASSNMIFAWLVTSRPPFTDLLDQRKAEALAVLAHYAVLLHRRRESWVIGNAGLRLFRRVQQYLGSRWHSWLAWPLSTLATSSEVSTPAAMSVRSEPGHITTPG